MVREDEFLRKHQACAKDAQLQWVELGKELTEEVENPSSELKRVQWDTMPPSHAMAYVLVHFPEAAISDAMVASKFRPMVTIGYHAVFGGLKGDPSLNRRFLLVCHLDKARSRVIVDATMQTSGYVPIDDVRMVSLPMANVLCCIPRQIEELGPLFAGNLEAACDVEGFDLDKAWVLRPYPQPGLSAGCIAKVSQVVRQSGGTVVAGWNVFGIGTKDWENTLFTSEFCPVFRRAKDDAMIIILDDFHDTCRPKLFLPDPVLTMQDVLHFLNLTDVLWGGVAQLVALQDACVDVKKARLSSEYNECVGVRKMATDRNMELVSRKLVIACKNETGSWSPEKREYFEDEDMNFYCGPIPMTLNVHDKCAYCNLRTVNAKKCGRCGRIKYCSTQCQHVHWASHKHDCLSPEERRRRFYAKAEAHNIQKTAAKAAADRERKEKEETAAVEAARRQRAAASREERARAAPAGFTVTHPPIPKERVVGRARNAEEQRQHDLHVDSAEKALRSMAFDEKQKVEHNEKVARNAKTARANRRQLERDMGAAEAAATHHVPAKPTLAAIVDDALRG